MLVAQWIEHQPPKLAVMGSIPIKHFCTCLHTSMFIGIISIITKFGGLALADNYDKIDTSKRNSALIQERVNLVSSHMYKQFLEYQDADKNTTEIFYEMINNLQIIVENLKQAFASRGIATQNIYLEKDSTRTCVCVNVFWNQFSFTTKCNFAPQSININGSPLPVLTGRIMALKGHYNKLINPNIPDKDQLSLLLEQELASLYVPADKNNNTVFKLSHRPNKEFYLAQIDAPKEFVLAILESVCGSTIYHKEGLLKL